MSNLKLGHMEKVDLRQIWETEAGDFTPWLVQENNLAILGDAIDIDLEHAVTEKNVGLFRADVLCKDTANDQWVLIENQLGRTDHTHLGQLLTYAAGLNAVTIVWIAAPFTEEHRATLDWLNDITDERFRFFGLELELWRIGESLPAPKFNIISKPNDWSRSISKATSDISDSVLTDTKQLQLAYWTAFREVLKVDPGPIRPTKPLPQNWINFPIKSGNFHMMAVINTRDRNISVILVCKGTEVKAHFHLLREEKDQIGMEIGASLDWR